MTGMVSRMVYVTSLCKIENEKKIFPNNKCVSKLLALDCKIHAHC